MRRLASVLAVFVAAWSCSPAPLREAATVPTWSFDESMIFPADRSLVRPEDGVATADGRLLVADQVHGLRLIAQDGTTRPFGRFAEAGYVHDPPAHAGGPNGVSLEPDGAHVLVADIFTGAIYRVDIASEATELVYQHQFGVNAARRDRTGALWFTQSTENAGPDSEARMFAAVDLSVLDGALFRIAPTAPGDPLPAPVRMVSDLYFANGFVIDEKTGHLYLSETGCDRVDAFRVDIATGELSDRRVIADIVTPDNLELDDAGRLWVVSPLRNEIVVVNPSNGQATSVFRAGSPDNDRTVAEWQRRGTAGEPRLELLTPDLWAPLPGLLTGLILTPGDGPVYLAGLGDALVRLPR
jgi:sugar lactone lactonase YvrE